MLINIGGNIYLFKKDILGIFDFEEFTSSVEGRDFFRNLEKNIMLEIAEPEKIPQSVILCIDEFKNEKYYLSSISVSTLRKNQGGEYL